MKYLVIALACLLSGCAAELRQSGSLRVGRGDLPRVMITSDDVLIVRVGAACWKVMALDYDRAHTEPKDLAYGDLEPIACPVERRSR